MPHRALALLLAAGRSSPGAFFLAPALARERYARRMPTPARLLAVAATCLLSTSALADVPASLDRAAISEAMNRVKPTVAACAKTAPAKGTVKVSLTVNADGTIATATIKASPDPALGECVLAAVKTATFAKTQKGGSFSYPFVF